MPINYADFSIGVLEFTNKARNSKFTEIDIKLIEKLCKSLADGLLQEEMETNLKNEQMKQRQMERSLNSNNLKTYVPLFNGLCSAIEKCLGFDKSIIYLYDETIDLLYSIPQINSEGELDHKGVIKMHSKRGFIGKVFSEAEILTANGKSEINKLLEAEERNLVKFDPKLNDITQTIGIPVKSKINDKVIGILQLYKFGEHIHHPSSKQSAGKRRK